MPIMTTIFSVNLHGIGWKKPAGGVAVELAAVHGFRNKERGKLAWSSRLQRMTWKSPLLAKTGFSVKQVSAPTSGRSIALNAAHHHVTVQYSSSQC